MSDFVDGWDHGGYTPAVTTSWKDRLHQVRRRKRVLSAEITPPESHQPESRDETEIVAEDREFLAALRERLGAPAVHERESLAAHTSLRVGGPADVLVVADDMEGLRDAVSVAWDHDVPCRVLGAGSNVLVSDRGVPGLVVINRAKEIKFSQHSVRAQSGASFSTVAQRCVTRGLAGLEWAAGVPGTVGGAVVGNAGAWGGDVASTLHSALILEPGGSVTSWGVERLDYGYRQSALKGAKRAPGGTGASRQPVVLEATFNLQPGDRHALRARVVEIAARRRASQPSGATCGSVFRNPPGDHAGRLIEAAGLKGEHQGNALISPVHANFIVNLGGASASDILALIKLAYRSVKEQSGVRLELEIELLGRW